MVPLGEQTAAGKGGKAPLGVRTGTSERWKQFLASGVRSHVSENIEQEMTHQKLGERVAPSPNGHASGTAGLHTMQTEETWHWELIAQPVLMAAHSGGRIAQSSSAY